MQPHVDYLPGQVFEGGGWHLSRISARDGVPRATVHLPRPIAPHTRAQHTAGCGPTLASSRTSPCQQGQDSSQHVCGCVCVYLAMFSVHLKHTIFYLLVTQVHMSFCLNFHYVYNHVQCLQLHVHVFIPSPCAVIGWVWRLSGSHWVWFRKDSSLKQ